MNVIVLETWIGSVVARKRYVIDDGLFERIQEMLDNHEPRETGEAWAGGFAENH